MRAGKARLIRAGITMARNDARLVVMFDGKPMSMKLDSFFIRGPLQRTWPLTAQAHRRTYPKAIHQARMRASLERLLRDIEATP